MLFLLILMIFPNFVMGEDKVVVVLGSFINENMAVEAAANMAAHVQLPLTIESIEVGDGTNTVVYHRISTMPIDSRIGKNVLGALRHLYPDAWILRSS